MSDDDYMSNSFLNAAEDVRPGLIFSRQVKRKNDIQGKKGESNEQHKTKSRKQLEIESRNTGLEAALSSNNKGFTMLTKMGYKPGMKLGVCEGNSSSSGGLIEPIKIQVKSGRGGLGIEAEKSKKIHELEKKKWELKIFREKQAEQLKNEFHERIKQKVSMNYLIADLNKCQKVCQQLDIENKIDKPVKPWFWCLQELSSDESDTEDENEKEIGPEDQLMMILEYLRETYLYCLWCGIKFSDETDLVDNCPGTKKEDHDV